MNLLIDIVGGGCTVLDREADDRCGVAGQLSPFILVERVDQLSRDPSTLG
jgi:hypothetical protein